MSILGCLVVEKQLIKVVFFFNFLKKKSRWPPSLKLKFRSQPVMRFSVYHQNQSCIWSGCSETADNSCFFKTIFS